MNNSEVVEISKAVKAANKKLERITAGNIPYRLEDVMITFSDNGGEVTIKSGAVEKVSTSKFDEAWEAIFAGTVDKVRAEVCNRLGVTEAALMGYGKEKHKEQHKEQRKEQHKALGLKAALDELISKVNSQLYTLVKGKDLYSFKEVEVTMSQDSAGIYVRSGGQLVSVASPVLGNAVAVVRDDLWAMVSATRDALDRRESLFGDLSSLAEESQRIDKEAEAVAAAINLLQEAGATVPASMVSCLPDAKAAEAITEAAKKAAAEANKGLAFSYEKAIDALGGRKAASLVVKGFSGGVVVMAGDKPCLVTRFPKIGAAVAVEAMVNHITAAVSAIGESRRKFFASLQKLLEREEAFHEVAKTLDEAQEKLKAAMA